MTVLFKMLSRNNNEIPPSAYVAVGMTTTLGLYCGRGIKHWILFRQHCRAPFSALQEVILSEQRERRISNNASEESRTTQAKNLEQRKRKISNNASEESRTT
jgi:hypothetical protein